MALIRCSLCNYGHEPNEDCPDIVGLRAEVERLTTMLALYRARNARKMKRYRANRKAREEADPFMHVRKEWQV